MASFSRWYGITWRVHFEIGAPVQFYIIGGVLLLALVWTLYEFLKCRSSTVKGVFPRESVHISVITASIAVVSFYFITMLVRPTESPDLRLRLLRGRPQQEVRSNTATTVGHLCLSELSSVRNVAGHNSKRLNQPLRKKLFPTIQHADQQY